MAKYGQGKLEIRTRRIETVWHGAPSFSKADWHLQLAQDSRLRNSFERAKEKIDALPRGKRCKIGFESIPQIGTHNFFTVLERYALSKGHEVVPLAPPAMYAKLQGIRTMMLALHVLEKARLDDPEHTAIYRKEEKKARRILANKFSSPNFLHLDFRKLIISRVKENAKLSDKILLALHKHDLDLAFIGGGHGRDIKPFVRRRIRIDPGLLAEMNELELGILETLGSESYDRLLLRSLQAREKLVGRLKNKAGLNH
ncbi:MAG: hypothetical protein V1835_07120 [Candidatus Micrarchaeota archaeon]